MIVIKDGKGSGISAEVKSNNKLATEAVTTTRAAYFADVLDSSYIVANGDYVSLTTLNTQTAILYLKYTGEGDLHISNIRTCGDVHQKWKLYKNITGGTILSGTNALLNNSRFNTSSELDATAKYGADGTTLSGGDLIEVWINHEGHSIEDYDGALILGKNDSVTLTCEVMSAGEVCARIFCFEDEGAVL